MLFVFVRQRGRAIVHRGCPFVGRGGPFVRRGRAFVAGGSALVVAESILPRPRGVACGERVLVLRLLPLTFGGGSFLIASSGHWTTVFRFHEGRRRYDSSVDLGAPRLAYSFAHAGSWNVNSGPLPSGPST